MQNAEINTNKNMAVDKFEIGDKICTNAMGILLDVESALASLGDPQDDSIDWHATKVTMSATFVGCMATMLLAYAAKYEGYEPHSKSDLYLLQMAENQEEMYLN